MTTHATSITEVTRRWHLIDARGQVLGRLATRIAKLLMGKDKTDFVRYLDMGDHVVVINAAKIVVTGKKADQKLYHRHSGYPGGMTVTPYFRMLQTHPERIIQAAVKGMLPKNRLQAKMLIHLHVYPGPDHPYAKQFKQTPEKKLTGNT